MAAVTPINLTAYSFETPAGSIDGATSGGSLLAMESCEVACSFTGTYVQGTGFSITSAQFIAAIAAVRRDGSTITIWDVCSDGPGLEGSAVVVPGTVAFTSSAGPATGLIYGPDFATEHAAAALGTFSSPCVFRVSFTAVSAA